MSDQMNPMGPAEPEIMSQDAENVIGLQPGQSDREGAMAKADLYKIANYSHKLFKQIDDQDQINLETLNILYKLNKNDYHFDDYHEISNKIIDTVK